MTRCHARQTGAAHLLVVLLLLALMLLGVLGLQRSSLVELRASAQSLAAARAFEAAEAGLDWAQALLDGHAPAGADCRPQPGATSSVRERWTAGTTAQAACVADPAGWNCACPAGGAAPTLTVPAAAPAAFTLRIEPTARAGQWRVIASGGTGALPDGRRHEAIFARLPALLRPPAAAVLQRPAGEAAGRFFAANFGLSPTAWRAQPVVRRVACAGDCGVAAASAIEAGAPLLAFDGDADLGGPRTLGSPTRPVAIVASGALLLRQVVVHGLVYGASVTLGSGAQVRGAVISEGAVGGDLALQVVHDPALLAGVAAHGPIVRLPGSWRDF